MNKSLNLKDFYIGQKVYLHRVVNSELLEHEDREHVVVKISNKAVFLNDCLFGSIDLQQAKIAPIFHFYDVYLTKQERTDAVERFNLKSKIASKLTYSQDIKNIKVNDLIVLRKITKTLTP